MASGSWQKAIVRAPPRSFASLEDDTAGGRRNKAAVPWDTQNGTAAVL